jgi:hypothetical protein
MFHLVVLPRAIIAVDRNFAAKIAFAFMDSTIKSPKLVE